MGKRNLRLPYQFHELSRDLNDARVEVSESSNNLDQASSSFTNECSVNGHANVYIDSLVNVPIGVCTDAVSLSLTSPSTPYFRTPRDETDSGLLSIPVFYASTMVKGGKTLFNRMMLSGDSSSKDPNNMSHCVNYLGHKTPDEASVIPEAPNCEFCMAKRYHREPAGFCCSSGEVRIASHPFPNALWDLFTGTDDISLKFKTFVRTYNNSFAFTSFGVHYDKDLSKRNRGVYTFKAQGQIYHYINPLLPTDRQPRHLQLYFYDTQHEMTNRLQLSENMDAILVGRLIDILQANPYSRFFRSLRDLQDLEECKILIRTTTSLDQRVYNAPTSSEVAAIWVENDTVEGYSGPDIVVYSNSGVSTKVHYYYGCYDPLQYPLLFPHGENGWHQGIKRTRRGQVMHNDSDALPHISGIHTVDELISAEDEAASSRKSKSYVTCREYYAFKLQIRAEHRCFFLHTGRIFQQYVVDMYIKLESSRLDFLRNNQRKIRAELYSGIVDSLAIGERRGSQVGTRIILPASFIGGPRDMRRRYLDAMTLVQKFGKPDLFLTMTCNPAWPEIKQELLPGEEAQNRPDLLARVFRAKFEELKNDIFTTKICGKIAAHVYVIEFQKRGLPHMHMLLIFENGSKIRTPEQFDHYVSAELPDKVSCPYLYKVVRKHMIHGPCGSLNPNCPCMQKKTFCSKHFPKDFCARTTQTEDSYPLYKRANNGRTVEVRGHVLDNRWVIPYNPYLLAKYNCHINVEVCSTVKAVKYLYKYIYKGHDRVSFHLSSNEEPDVVDEISQFRDGRWISPPEAMWRIYRFFLNEVTPAVLSLQLHLEDNQSISYNDSSDLQSVVDNTLNKRTTLTEYFLENRTNPNARNLLYRDFPERYVWDRRGKKWQIRKRGYVIGRVVSANPIEGERYYLRLLLNNVKGATGFNDLRKVNNTMCNSFRDAATLLGLVELDDCYRVCLRESIVYQMPRSLRRLFATLLVYCNPVNCRALWEEFAEPLSEDYARGEDVDKESASNMALGDIASHLESIGKSINDYKLIDGDFINTELDRGQREINDELLLPSPQADIENVSILNKAQRQAFDIIFDCVISGKHGSFFIDGPGGTGKSFLYSVILAHVRQRGFVALATASSGVAASILPGGRTAHSRFKIPVENDGQSCCNIKKQSGLAKLLRAAKLIIWDEAPMVRRQSIETFERMLRDICESELVFGGKVVVFGGDFRQILPVIPKASADEMIEASLVKSPLWSKLRKFRLVDNVRARLDPDFSEFLLKLGEGRIPYIFADEIRLPDSMVLPYVGNGSLDSLLDLTFPNLHSYTSNINLMINRAVLSSKNEFVDEINETIINRFSGEECIYRSFDRALDMSQQGLQEDFFNILTPSGFPPHILKLKKSCPVMLLRNIDPSQGLCNGTRLTCTGFESNTLSATIATGNYTGKHVLLPRIPFTPSTGEVTAFPFRRRQFPIKLCFGMTINKAQGQTLDFVGVYLPQPVFSHGQLYVALSRSRDIKSIAVLIVPADENIDDSATTRNVVYKRVLDLAALD